MVGGPDQAVFAMNPAVDQYLKRARQWSQEMQLLRTILLDCKLEEELKWAKPCYTAGQKNIAIIQPMKAYCALMFFKGALITDPGGLLVPPGPNSRAARQLRFASISEINKHKAAVRRFVKAAIAAEKSGQQVQPAPSMQWPDELQAELQADPALQKAFEALTPGRQRGYLLHFNSAKKSETRTTRIQKCRPRILAGRGLQDR